MRMENYSSNNYIQVSDYLKNCLRQLIVFSEKRKVNREEGPIYSSLLGNEVLG